MKLTTKLIILGIFISIFIGFTTASVRIYESNNTRVEKAIVVQSTVTYDSTGNVDDYVTVVEYNFNTYKFTDKDIYYKYHSKLNEYINVYVCTYRFSKVLPFLDDEDLVDVV